MPKHSIFLFIACLFVCAFHIDAQEQTMLVGTYTDTDSKGIYTFKFNDKSGTADLLSTTEIENPSFIAISKDKKTVYSISESPANKAKATSFAFDHTTGKLTPESEQTTNAAGPCHVTTTEKEVITANYSDGSITVFPLDEKGKLLPAKDVIKFNDTGKDADRQNVSHLHSTQVTPDGKYLIAANLGGDCLYCFPLKNKCIEDTISKKIMLPPGSGPRHFVFSKNSKYMYLLNEISGSIITFKYSKGQLKQVQEIQADTLYASGSADIHISPDGKFLYASNRLKGDGIAIFKIDSHNGLLKKEGYQQTGIHPRNFAITKNGEYLLVACRDDNVIQIFKRDKESGLLTNTHQDIKVDHPVCVIFANN